MGRGRLRGGAVVRRSAWEGKPDERRWTHGEAKRQARAGEDGGGLIEQLAEGLRGAGSVR